MKALKTHVAGVDVHREILAITVLRGTGDEDPSVDRFECKTFTEDLVAMGMHLKSLGVKDVAMESTGVYWKPVYHAWEPLGLNVIIGNATHMKNVPGRKTDMNDSHWIAQLHRFGLIRASFVPPGEFQRMRLLSRHRTNLTQDLATVKNRVQKVLEDGNIKYGVIAADVFGVSGLAILRLISDGVTKPERLAAAIKTRIKRKEEGKKALTNTLTREHCWVIAELMKQFDDLKARIRDVDEQLQIKVAPYAHLVEELRKIPGIDTVLAVGILAEATTDMSKFKDERTFAAWAGVAPGNNESAGKKKRSRCRPGNPALRKILIQGANGAVLKRGSFWRAKYNRLKFQLGSGNKAKVAIANRMARAIFKVLGGECYKDIGYARGDPREKQIDKLVRQLRALGVEIQHQDHELIYSVKKISVEASGIVLS